MKTLIDNIETVLCDLRESLDEADEKLEKAKKVIDKLGSFTKLIIKREYYDEDNYVYSLPRKLVSEMRETIFELDSLEEDDSDYNAEKRLKELNALSAAHKFVYDFASGHITLDEADQLGSPSYLKLVEAMKILNEY